MNKWEREDERVTAIHWFRPQKQYIYDTPYYPWTKIEPLVNFDLKFRE